MCGFIGVFSQNGVEKYRETLQDTILLLQHRGPNARGIWLDQYMALGHTRLSILDLSSLGDQPMVSACGRYIIAFNGEIYNFKEIQSKLTSGHAIRFRGHSDTEILLNAYITWGPKCVHELRGMFAFAIWDTLERKLFVARDRLGVKPLFYALSPDGDLAFASRPSPLLKLMAVNSSFQNLHAGNYNNQGIRYFIEGGFVPNDQTLFSGILKLKPGHYFEYQLGQKEPDLRTYWQIDNFKTIALTKSILEVESQFEELFQQAVKLRMISDVPLGAFLSGGIDSAITVSHMAQISEKPIKTFSIGFEEKEYDERQLARLTANHVGTDHVEEVLTIDGLIGLLPILFSKFDEPFFDSSAFPTMAVSQLARNYVTVVLTGDGGDEFFGGYSYYRYVHKMLPLFILPTNLRRYISQALSLTNGHKMSMLSAAISLPDIGTLFGFLRSIQKDFSSLLENDALVGTKGIVEYYSDKYFTLGQNDPKASSIEKLMRLDSQSILPDEYLPKVDMATMAYSIEARNPFLDHKLIEWALTLPLKYKIHNGKTKYLLRRIANKRLPKVIGSGKKRGFTIPIDKWLRTNLKEWATDTFNDPKLFSNLPISQVKVKKLYAEHLSHRRNAHPLLWATLMLLEYERHNRQQVH